ncbi:hypothetical protein ACNOYE_29695 [Nannocystaceae bacterium ST9]
MSSTPRELAPRVASPIDRSRRCTGTATTFALIGSTVMLPVLLATPMLLLLLPLGLLWLAGVVIPGATLTLRFYRYALGHRLPGGPRRMWSQTASFCGLFGGTLLYLSAAFGGGMLGVPAIAMCLAGGAALVARDRDRHAR